MSPETKYYISMAINLIIFLTMLAIFISYFREEGGRFSKKGLRSLRKYTVLSNLFLGISAGIFFVAEIVTGPEIAQGIIPGSALHTPILLKYMSTAAITLTFITVILYLGPTQGYGLMYSGTGMYTHLLGPILGIASFTLIETWDRLSLEEVFVGVVPTLIYGLVYTRQVVFAAEKNADGEYIRGWDDFYGFMIKGHWAIPFAVMLAIAWAICFVIRVVYNMKIGY